MMRALLAGALLAAGAAAAEPAAAPAAQWWLNPGFYSWHFDRDADLREDNTGFGVEFVPAERHAWMAGSFINSTRDRTRYAGYQWRALRWEFGGLAVRAGVALAVLDGYPRMRDGGAFVAALPLLAIEGRTFGANLTVIPSLGDRVQGAVAIQLKLRVR